jgi:hypothetical protein
MEHEEDFVTFERDGATWIRYGDGVCEQIDGFDYTYVVIERDGVSWHLCSDGSYSGPWTVPVEA